LEKIMPIYADFNGLEGADSSSGFVLLDLTGYGTLASLSLHQVRLREGQRLLLGDPDGLWVTAEIEFNPSRRSPTSSGWFAKFQKSDIQESIPMEHDYNTHLCFKCRRNLKPYLDNVGRQFNENCPNCGTPVMFPLSPPEK
jgi:hypothetical protein